MTLSHIAPKFVPSLAPAPRRPGGHRSTGRDVEHATPRRAPLRQNVRNADTLPAGQPKSRIVPRLIGRERELDAIKDLFSARPAISTSVLVQGDAGSGKSALLRAAVEEIRGEADIVVSASGDAMESGFAFGVVRQLFEHLARAAGEGPDSPLSGHAAGVVPLLLGPPGHQHCGGPLLQGQEEELLRSLYWLASNLTTNGRLIVVIDDLQWADSHSLRWLHFMLRRASNLPLVVLASLGMEPIPDGTETTGAELQLFRHELVLRPLECDTVADVVEHTLGPTADAAFSAACRSATGGNLFLLQALLRTLRRSGATPDARTASELTRYAPAGVGRAAHGLIKNSGPHALAVAQALTVLDGSADVVLLAGVAGLAEGALQDAVHGLVRIGLMTRTDDIVAFASPLVSASFAEEVVPSRRQELHARAARLLLAQDAPLENVAAHFQQAPLGVPGAAETLRAAAAQAAQKSRPEDAIVLIRRALREMVSDECRATLLISLGRVELATHIPDAIRHLQRGLELSQDTTERTATARALSRALFTLDRYPEGLAVLRSTSAALRPTDSANALRLEVDFLYGSVCHPGSASAVMPRLRELQLSDAQGTSAERPLAALLSLRALMDNRDPQEVVCMAQRALSNGLHPGDDESLVYLGAVIALGAAGQSELAFTYVDAAVDEARTQGSALAYAYALSARAAMRTRLGQVLESQADAQLTLEVLGEIGVERNCTRSLAATAALMDALTKQGELDEAAVLLEKGWLDGDLNGHWINDYVLLSRGRLRMAQGRTREALADFLMSGHRTCARKLPGAGVLPWRSEAALAHAALGERDAALALAQDELAHARRWGVPEIEGGALRALGLVTGGTEGLALLREAVEILKGTAAKYQLAQATGDFGARAREAGDLPEARIHLQHAVSIAHQIGATAVAEAALAELRALGDRPRTRAFCGVDSLTPTERRVADLAAQGLTNKAIAQHLFVGLRTVEVHLTNAYRKLDIDGRPALAEALSRTD
ncbi:LuxR family transcriptional regulator [Streptomyces sp. RKAG293]|uniref:ATP-binding protein n=1 Tax=Streptomyces sp. RKAG293 TaxID=2893403 RepID=UPI00203388D5|nr:LuxR family transcriptional regulator [Streptomyces sp. RKAG293]MCM2422654.1 AAA family ATPase [Streptomyces sp. RKAG293]